jgi:hypothetical protein
MHLKIVLIFALISMGSCGRIDVIKSEEVKSTTETTEKSHLELILEKSEPSVSEDHIKVLNIEDGNIYSAKAKGKPEMFRKFTEKLHAVNPTNFDDSETTTKLNPESTSHSHVYERTAHTKTTVHKTKHATTEMSTTVHHARSKRSFTKDELQSFAEMGKVFSESFKKFNEDAEKAQKDFMSFMKKLDDLSAAHDHY